MQFEFEPLTCTKFSNTEAAAEITLNPVAKSVPGRLNDILSGLNVDTSTSG